MKLSNTKGSSDPTMLLMKANGNHEAIKRVFMNARPGVTEKHAEGMLRLRSEAQHRCLDMLVVKDGVEHRHTPAEALEGAQEFERQHQQYWQSGLHG